MDRRQLRLVTNLHDIYIHGVRLHSHAMLLETPVPLGSAPAECGQIRGFKTDAASEVFTFGLKCGPLDYERTHPITGNVFGSDNGALKELISGERWKFKDGTVIMIVKHVPEKPFVINDYIDIRQVWQDLLPQVADHWTAPAMPMSQYLPVPIARAADEERQRMYG